MTNKTKETSNKSFLTIPPLSIKNELKILEILEKMCYEALNKYPNSIEVRIFNILRKMKK